MTRLNRPVTGPDGITRHPGEDHTLPDGLEERYAKMGLVEGREKEGPQAGDPNNAEPSEDVKAWNEKSRKENADAIKRLDRSGVGTTVRPLTGSAAEPAAKMNAPADNKARV